MKVVIARSVGDVAIALHFRSRSAATKQFQVKLLRTRVATTRESAPKPRFRDGGHQAAKCDTDVRDHNRNTSSADTSASSRSARGTCGAVPSTPSSAGLTSGVSASVRPPPANCNSSPVKSAPTDTFSIPICIYRKLISLQLDPSPIARLGVAIRPDGLDNLHYA